MVTSTGVLSPAATMNREGHDEGWMMEVPTGIQAFTNGEAQKATPSPLFAPVTWEKVRVNAYEQIPLRGTAVGDPHRVDSG